MRAESGNPTIATEFPYLLVAYALVLALEDVLSLAVPAQQQDGNSRPAYSAPARPAPKLEPSSIAGTPLG